MFKQSYVIAIFTRSVAQWLDDISASRRNSLERKSFEAALRQSEFDFSDPSVKAGIV
jgi:hypothetical protein